MKKYTVVKIKSGDGWHENKGTVNTWDFDNVNSAMKFMLDDSEDMTAKWPELCDITTSLAIEPVMLFAAKNWDFCVSYHIVTSEV